MSRLFTAGTGDRIKTALTTHATTRTWALWANQFSDTETQKLFDKRGDSGNLAEQLAFYAAGGVFNFKRAYATTDAVWKVTAPPISGWHHIAITYNSSLTANDPKIYINGVAQTVTQTQTAAGALTTTADALIIGNGSASETVSYSGRLAEFAVWDRILAAAEILILARGYVPMVHLRGLVSYLPLIRLQDLKTGVSAIVTGTSVADHPRILRPSRGVSFGGTALSTVQANIAVSVETVRGISAVASSRVENKARTDAQKTAQLESKAPVSALWQTRIAYPQGLSALRTTWLDDKQTTFRLALTRGEWGGAAGAVGVEIEVRCEIKASVISAKSAVTSFSGYTLASRLALAEWGGTVVFIKGVNRTFHGKKISRRFSLPQARRLF